MQRTPIMLTSIRSSRRSVPAAFRLNFMREQSTSKQPLMHRILHGNQEAQEEIQAAVETREVNFSQKIARGKYIHEIMVHEVKPECLTEYIELM